MMRKTTVGVEFFLITYLLTADLIFLNTVYSASGPLFTFFAKAKGFRATYPRQWYSP